MTVHAFTEDGLTLFDDEPDVPEPESTELDELAIELPEVPTDAGFMLPGSKSIAERKEELRELNFDIAKRLVDFTGWGHAKVQAELNRLVGHHVGGQRHQRPARTAAAPRRDLVAAPLTRPRVPPVALRHACQRRAPSRLRGVLRVHLRAAGGRRRRHPGAHRRSPAGQPTGRQRDDPSASRPRA